MNYKNDKNVTLIQLTRDFKIKLGRELTKKEKDLLVWIISKINVSVD